MSNNQVKSIHRDLKQDDLIVIAGAGGFIGGSLVRYFHDLGYTRIRAVDKKPLSNWYQRIADVENLCLDLSKSESCVRAVEGAVEVYNLAADMGGMGFIERFRVECMRSSLINTHMLEAAYQAGVNRYFFSSSACVYNTLLATGSERAGFERVRRFSGNGRTRLWLGKAICRDALPGILGGAAHEDIYGAFP